MHLRFIPQLILTALALSAWSRGGPVSAPVSAPTVSQVLPYGGGKAGGTNVVITGTNFSTVSAVKFGTTASVYTVNSPTQITVASAPAGTGTVDITVTTAAGTSAVASTCTLTAGQPLPTPCDEFTYGDVNETFVAGTTDPNGVVLGGTELRGILFHTVPNGGTLNATASITCAVTAGCPTLFAGNGFWHSASCAAIPSSQGPQVLELFYPGGLWYQDAELGHATGACTGGAFDVMNSLYEIGFNGTNVVVANPEQATTAGHSAYARNDTSGLWVGTDMSTVTNESGATRSAMGYKDTSGAGSVYYALFGNDGAGAIPATLNLTTYVFSFPTGAAEPYAQTIGGTKCTTGPASCTNIGNLATFVNIRVMAMAQCGSTDHANTDGNAAYQSVGYEVYKRIPVTTGGVDTSYWVLWATLGAPYVTQASENGFRGMSCVSWNGTPELIAVAQSSLQRVWMFDPNNQLASPTLVTAAGINGLTTLSSAQWGGTNAGINAYNYMRQTAGGTIYFGEGDGQNAPAIRPQWGGATADVISGFWTLSYPGTFGLYPAAGQEQTDLYNAMAKKVNVPPATAGHGCVNPGPCVVMSATRDIVHSLFPSNLQMSFFAGIDCGACTYSTSTGVDNTAWVMSAPDSYFGNPFQ